MLRCFVVAGLVASCLTVADGQSASLGGGPLARWIAPASVPGDSFVVFHARRAFELSNVPAHFPVQVSADNRYRLFLNGVSISSGPQRSDVAHWRFETVDLAPGLHVGRNVLAAVVWNWGALRPVAQHSHRTGFIVQGEGSAAAHTLFLFRVARRKRKRPEDGYFTRQQTGKIGANGLTWKRHRLL